MFVTGEAGIGKSRLARETARVAGARGLAVLGGRSVAGGVPTPFRPFAEALAAAGRWAGRGSLREADELAGSPRTVEKHVASLLAKTGLRRSQPTAYSASLDG